MKTLLVSLFVAGGLAAFAQVPAGPVGGPRPLHAPALLEKAKADKAAVDALSATPAPLDKDDVIQIQNLQLDEVTAAYNLKQLETEYKKISATLEASQNAEIELSKKLVTKYHAEGYHLNRSRAWEKDAPAQPEVKK